MLINGIFEGGGIKGLAYVGVMRFLEERGFQFQFVGGTSIGALFSSLIATGYNSYEIEDLIKNFDLNILTPQKKEKKIAKIISGFKEKGLYSIKPFEEYLENLFLLKNKTIFRDVKLGNNYLLKVIVTDLKNRKKIILPDDLKQYGYSPDGFKIAKAVAMSASLPLVFTPYTIGENTFVDGGVVNNFPITLFSQSLIPTLGFRLNADSKLTNFLNKYRSKVFKTECNYDFEKYNIISINTSDYKAADFKKGLENFQQLFLLGYNSMKEYFYQKFKC